MKKILFLNVLALAAFFSCSKNTESNIKHTCTLLSFKGEPIVGKRVRYFVAQEQLKFEETENLLAELTSNKDGKVYLDKTYDTRKGWVVMAVEPSDNEFVLNDAKILNGEVDTVFFDKLIPFKLRLKSTEDKKNEIYSFRKVSFSNVTDKQRNKSLFYWSDNKPIKAPFDTIINIKMVAHAPCIGVGESRILNKDISYGSIYTLELASRISDSTFLIRF